MRPEAVYPVVGAHSNTNMVDQIFPDWIRNLQLMVKAAKNRPPSPTLGLAGGEAEGQERKSRRTAGCP
jgi:hypothetical protein